MSDLAEALGLLLILIGSLFCLTAAIGVLRFGDLLSRMHAAAKPQVLGLALVLIGIALEVQAWAAVPVLLLVGLFQFLTIPVAAQMLARAAHRTGHSDTSGPSRPTPPGTLPPHA